MYKVLFVCAGNICRSPLGEVIFRHLVEERGLGDKFYAESRATGGWHEGDGADPRSVAEAKRRGLSLNEHVAHQMREQDFEEFDLILAMDRMNYRDLERRAGNAKHKLRMLRSYDPKAPHLEVPDPYLGGPEGFRDSYDMIYAACAELLECLVN